MRYRQSERVCVCGREKWKHRMKVFLQPCVFMDYMNFPCWYPRPACCVVQGECCILARAQQKMTSGCVAVRRGCEERNEKVNLFTPCFLALVNLRRWCSVRYDGGKQKERKSRKMVKHWMIFGAQERIIDDKRGKGVKNSWTTNKTPTQRTFLSASCPCRAGSKPMAGGQEVLLDGSVFAKSIWWRASDKVFLIRCFRLVEVFITIFLRW